MAQLSESEIDAMKEIGNIGIGNATTALSKIINKKIDINIPETKFVPLEKFAQELGGAEKIVISLYLEFTGDIQGQCVFAFPESSTLELIDLIMGNPSGTTKTVDGMGESAFMEMSNIFAGAYLSSLANMLGMKIFPSVPHIANDMVQSIIDVLLIKVSRTADKMLAVKAKITIAGHNVDGDFILLFEEESLNKLLDALAKSYGLSR